MAPRDPPSAALVFLIPLAGALFALSCWLLLTPEQVFRLMNEAGPIEGLSAFLYFLLAAGVWLLRPPPGDLRNVLALSVLLAAAGARELDWHKAFTGLSVLKVKYHLGPAPLGAKLLALAILAVVAWALVSLLRRHAARLWQELRAGQPLAVAIACLVATLVLSKLLDRAINILAEDFGVVTPVVVRALVAPMEETLELALPLIAAYALWLHRRAPWSAVARQGATGPRQA